MSSSNIQNASKIYEGASKYSSYILLTLCVLSVIIVIFVLNYRYSQSLSVTKMTTFKPTVALNENIGITNDNNGLLYDYYILSAYNCCVSGPYNQGVVSITNMLNAIALGYRFLDFEIYSSAGEEPIISCSTSKSKCGSQPESYNYVSFSDVMKYIKLYAFSNSGCMNFKDPLIINLRIKSCNVNLLSSMATIFDGYRSIMLGPEYSYNNNNNNFMATKLSALSGKVSIFVESTSIDYTSNRNFMEYVNCSKVTGFLNVMTQREFTQMKDVKDMIEYNKQNMTIIIPNPREINPHNTVLEAYQFAGCHCVCMLLWQNDSYLSKNNDYFFGKYKCAFVMKPSDLRYSAPTVKSSTPQTLQNSYQSRSLTTGVAGITYNI